MCGIAVIQGGSGGRGYRYVEQMLQVISYRGYKNFEIDGSQGCVLGANRLDIVDRENGAQPAWNEDHSICAVLNGEIYNFNILLNIMKQRGHLLKSQCDTEVIVHCYEEWGPEFVAYLDGMFSLAVLNTKTGKLMVARDPYGVKPLYVSVGSQLIAFASEMKAFSRVPSARVFPFPPGSVLWNDKIKPFYRYPVLSPRLSFDAARSRLYLLLRESVLKRIQTDLPVAVFVSGGIDSAIVLRLAMECHPDVTAISVGFKGSPDLAAATELCAHLGVKHIYKELDGLSLGDLYEKLIYHLESFEPNLVRASIFTFLMSKLAHAHGFRVALAGEGSDELFAGYADFAELEDPKNIHRELQIFFRNLHRTQLLRWDKIAMANTLEVRFPFMDRSIVEFAWNLPTAFKLTRVGGKAVTKHILRSAFADLLPPQFIQREKVPMDEGACPNGKEQLEQILGSHLTRNRPGKLPYEVASRFKLRCDEEAYNFLVLRDLCGSVDFARHRIKVRRK